MDDFRETLGYNLLKLYKGYFYLLNTRLSAFNLYESQDMLLRQLWDEDGLPQAELTRRLGVEAATVSKAVERMENAGFLRRQPDPDDARANRIYLTEQGRGLEQPVKQVWQEIEAQVFAHMTAEERMLLRRLVLQMRENLTSAT
ncbi:MAG TPA: MarR family transcriptional regulator [Phototrophicaceae bacterium]|nr:MarR family transcriptional regulator [Phototrophicaceae bacterium]